MSADADPPWDLLPHDPLGFFGLDPGWDERELKRRYGRLIKRFRPERDPEAFQRIRAAYEALTARSEPPRALPSPTPRLDADPPTAPGAPADDPLAAHADTPLDALQRLLAGAEPRTAAHHLALALLSDAPGVEDTRGALGWLLEGLRRAPSEPRLLALLEAHLTREVEAAAAGEALRRCAGALERARFYPVTLGLWRRWLREGDPAEVEATLAACEQALGLAHDDGAEAWFLVGLLRPAALWGGADLVRGLATRLGSSSAEARDLDYELEVARALRGYAVERAAFLAAPGPLRARLDAAIVALVLAAPGAVEGLLALAADVAADPAPALAALPPGDRGAAAAVEALRWLALELHPAGVGARRPAPPLPEVALAPLAALEPAEGWRMALAIGGPFAALGLGLWAAVQGLGRLWPADAGAGPQHVQLLLAGLALALLVPGMRASLRRGVEGEARARREAWREQRVELARLLAWSHLRVEQVLACHAPPLAQVAAAAAADPALALVELAQELAHA